MRNRNPFPFLMQNPGGDGGAGGFGGGNSGGGSAWGGGDGGSRGDSGSGGAGASQPIRLTDDALVDTGDGKPVKYGDYKKNFLSRDDHSRELTNYQQQLYTRLQQIAKQAQAMKQRKGQQGNERPDPIANLRGKQIVGGEDIGGLYETLNTERLTPMEQQLQQLQQRIEQLQGGVGSMAERNATGDHQARMDGAIQALGLGEEYDHADPVLRELAEDVYLSYDPRDPKLNSEYPGLLKQRVEGIIKLVRKADQRKLELAKTKKRVFTRPGGNGQPGGQARGQVESAKTLASRLFASEGSST